MDYLDIDQEEIDALLLVCGIIPPPPKPVSLIKPPKPKLPKPIDRLAVREARMKKHYGLSLQGYADLLASQGGGCAGCGSTERLSVDHDHSCCPGTVTCGQCVRGILCSRCNTAIGYARDNPQTLKALAEYLVGCQA